MAYPSICICRASSSQLLFNEIYIFFNSLYTFLDSLDLEQWKYFVKLTENRKKKLSPWILVPL